LFGLARAQIIFGKIAITNPCATLNPWTSDGYAPLVFFCAEVVEETGRLTRKR
jgi:hypothetical protein